MKLSKALRQHLAFQEARGDSLPHRKECERILTGFIEYAGDLEVLDLAPDDLRRFMATIRRRPGKKGRAQVSDLTVLAYHRTLNTFFNRLELEGIIRQSPMRHVPKPRVNQELVRPFTEEQVGKLLAQPDVRTFTGLRDATLMCLLLDTGCRIAESLSLTLENLDLEQRIARIQGKGGKERLVPFGATTLAWLERYHERRSEGEAAPFVFVNQYGEKLTPNTMSHRIAAYGKKAGIRGVRVSPHTFRHTFSVNWLPGQGDYKGDTLSLQKILGHSTPVMTQRYVHLAGQDLRKLHDRLSPADRCFSRPPEEKRVRFR